MRKMRVSLAFLGAAALMVTACGRSDDSGSTATTGAAATTAAPSTTAGGGGTETTEAGGGTETTEGGSSTEAPTTAPAETSKSDVVTAAQIEEQCKSEPLEATEVGVTADKITIEVMADTGSPLAPGLFQGNIDAIKAYADYVNANGGVGCRQVEVREWDSKLDPTESKNGLIDACANAVAMIGGNSLFNPDISPMSQCVDKNNAATGLPNVAALANDTTELCGPTTYVIQLVAESCPINVGQERTFNMVTGLTSYLLSQNPGGLNGLFLVPGDLPTTRQSAVPLIAAQEAAGVTFDGVKLVSGRDEQAAFTPRVQILKENNGNYVYDGSNDVAMIKMQKETIAQGIDHDSVVWACSLACYTDAMIDQGGSTVDGTYLWMQFLPFEEADTNPAMKAYVDQVGADNVVSWGAQAWQAALAFQTVVNQIVLDQGPNAITRAAILEGLSGLDNFSADGWMGAKSLRGASNCFVVLQIQDGAYVRVFPEERGTMSCSDDNITQVTVEPVSAADQMS